MLGDVHVVPAGNKRVSHHSERTLQSDDAWRGDLLPGAVINDVTGETHEIEVLDRRRDGRQGCLADLDQIAMRA